MKQSTTIHRERSQDPFCRIPNSTIADENLSFRAKGILAYLLSKPDDWKPRVSDISNHGTEGSSAVSSALIQLRESNYAELRKVYRAGRVWAWRLIVSDVPKFKSNGKIVTVKEAVKSDHENQEVENVEMENQHLGFQVRTNKDSTKTDNTKKEGTSSRAIAQSQLFDLTADVPEVEPENSEPETPHHEFMRLWSLAYSRTHDEKPVIGPRDGKALKEFLRCDGCPDMETIFKTVKQAWDHPQGFWSKQASTMHGFLKHFGSIRAELRLLHTPRDVDGRKMFGRSAE